MMSSEYETVNPKQRSGESERAGCGSNRGRQAESQLDRRRCPPGHIYDMYGCVYMVVYMYVYGCMYYTWMYR